MQKTKFGITVGLYGAAVFFSALFGGYTATIILAGYALLFEENAWLKRSVIKAVSLMVFFSVLTAVINLIPNVIDLINNVVAVFGGKFGIPFLAKIITAVVSGINLAEKVLFLGLGFKAFHQGTIVFPAIDKIISKHME